MNNIKHIAIAISALSAMGIASFSLASNCPTSISPETAQCLSKNADAAFQQNYRNDYIKQKGGADSAYYSGGSGNANSSLNYSVPHYKAPQTQTQVQQQTTTSQPSYSNTNNNNSKRKPIRWF